MAFRDLNLVKHGNYIKLNKVLSTIKYVLGIKASGYYLGQVEANYLHVRQAAFI